MLRGRVGRGAGRACCSPKGFGKRRKEKQTETNLRQIPRPVAITAPKPWIAAVKAYVPPYARLTAEMSHARAEGSSPSRLLASASSPCWRGEQSE
jgi:hypothetical protein